MYDISPQGPERVQVEKLDQRFKEPMFVQFFVYFSYLKQFVAL